MTTHTTHASDTTDVLALLERWAEAELNGDAETLASLLDPGFRGIGPVGFVLDATQWTARHHGDLENRRFDLTDVRVRHYGTTAVADTVVVQETRAMGRDTSGSFRVGLVAVSRDEGWVLAQAQFSGPLIRPDEAPPFPREKHAGSTS